MNKSNTYFCTSFFKLGNVLSGIYAAMYVNLPLHIVLISNAWSHGESVCLNTGTDFIFKKGRLKSNVQLKQNKTFPTHVYSVYSMKFL